MSDKQKPLFYKSYIFWIGLVILWITFEIWNSDYRANQARQEFLQEVEQVKQTEGPL